VGVWCVLCGGRGTADAILNVVLFLPLGIDAGIRRRGGGAALVTGVGLSVLIELVQQLLPGRYPTLGDVLWNGLGAWAGWGAWTLLRVSVARSVWPARALAVAVGVWTLGAGMLLRPHWTEDDWWGQWTPELGHLAEYDGRVIEARLGQVELPGRRLPSGSDWRGMMYGDFELRTVVEKGTGPPSLAPIVSVYDGHQREQFILGAVGEDLVWRERNWASVLRFDRPDLRSPGALGGVAVGVPVELGVRRVGDSRCLLVDAAQFCADGYPTGRSWSTLLYFGAPSEGRLRALDLAWLFLLLAPIGLLAPTARERGMTGGGALLFMVGAASVTPLATIGPVELAVAVSGLLAGGLVRAWTERAGSGGEAGG
jgi:hypothetical protein